MPNIDYRFLLRKLRFFFQKLKLLISMKITVKLGKFVYIGKNVNLSDNITIGDCSYIGQYSYISPYVKIGNFALISDYVNVIGHDHIFDKPGLPIILSGKPEPIITEIGDDVWIGHGVTIMRGIKIGNGSIVAANSVVTKDISAYEIWGGIPAKKIRNRFNESEISIHEFFLNNYKLGKVKLSNDRQI